MKIENSIGINAAKYSQPQNTNEENQDSRLKSIQKQIEKVQEQLQSLSNNKEMSKEEKMNKRKELQEQLQVLTRQMFQRRMEIRQEKQEKSAAQAKRQDPVQENTGRQESIPMRTATMHGIISADTSMKQIKTVQSVKANMEGKAGVLEDEIKMDKGRGCPTEEKEAELAALNDRIDTASADMMTQIFDINTALEKSKNEDNSRETGNYETIQTEEKLNSTQSEASKNLVKGQYVDMNL